MNDLDIRKQIHHAVDDMTKTAKQDPWLAQRILAQEKGEQPMARKISASMVIAIVLIIISLSAALAAGLGIFDSLSRGGDPDERLPVLETVAQPVGTSQTTEDGEVSTHQDACGFSLLVEWMSRNLINGQLSV